MEIPRVVLSVEIKANPIIGQLSVKVVELHTEIPTDKIHSRLGL